MTYNMKIKALRESTITFYDIVELEVPDNCKDIEREAKSAVVIEASKSLPKREVKYTVKEIIR